MKVLHYKLSNILKFLKITDVLFLPPGRLHMVMQIWQSLQPLPLLESDGMMTECPIRNPVSGEYSTNAQVVRRYME